MKPAVKMTALLVLLAFSAAGCWVDGEIEVLPPRPAPGMIVDMPNVFGPDTTDHLAPTGADTEQSTGIVKQMPGATIESTLMEWGLTPEEAAEAKAKFDAGPPATVEGDDPGWEAEPLEPNPTIQDEGWEIYNGSHFTIQGKNSLFGPQLQLVIVVQMTRFICERGWVAAGGPTLIAGAAGGPWAAGIATFTMAELYLAACYAVETMEPDGCEAITARFPVLNTPIALGHAVNVDTNRCRHYIRR